MVVDEGTARAGHALKRATAAALGLTARLRVERLAGGIALIAAPKISQATPAAPERTIENVKRDLAAVKEHDQHG